MREISFEGSFNIGGFAAHDFFGDGSFYLLSTPGHTIGHMSALARTTASTFVFLGGDCCHYAGAYRPSPYLPLPSSFKPSPFTPNDSHSFCPGSAFQAAHPKHSATEPFLDLCGPVPHDIEAARVSIRGMEAFDASDDVLVIIAHDATLLGVMDLYPKSLNGWKESSTKPASRWRFLGDLKDAVDGNANMEGL
jgi:glyoxylase-like metal-dependent hydrolase (beta-lactamase superfamily II)